MIGRNFEKVLNALNDAICISDNNGIVLFINEPHTRLTGIKPHEIVGFDVRETIKHGLYDTVLNPEVVRTRQPIIKVQHVRSGKTLVLEGTPVFDENGDVSLVVTIIRDITKLTEMQEQLSAQNELLEALKTLNSPADADISTPQILNSAAMRRLYGQARVIARTDATILLLGETGVGKDVLSRHVHKLSERDGPFIKADCGSIPESLIETELFGYAPGTFSGASKHGKVGLIEAAAGGTLFLDEIGELPLSMQSRLLRVIQDKEVQRVGSTSCKRVDVRFIAATNKNLEREVAAGRFRQDLYYRLKVAVLQLPPLRERKSDILPLARGFLAYYCKKYNRRVALAEAAEEILLEHSWPGNVRELENTLQGLVLTCDRNKIEARDLPFHVAKRQQKTDGLEELIPLDQPAGFKAVMKGLEQRVLRLYIDKYGSVSEASKRLGVDKSTIFRKLRN